MNEKIIQLIKKSFNRYVITVDGIIVQVIKKDYDDSDQEFLDHASSEFEEYVELHFGKNEPIKTRFG